MSCVWFTKQKNVSLTPAPDPCFEIFALLVRYGWYLVYMQGVGRYMTSFAHFKTVCMFAFFPGFGRDLKAFKYAHRKIKPFSKSFTRETQQNFQNIVLCGIYFYCLNGQSGVRFFSIQQSLAFIFLRDFGCFFTNISFSRNASFFGGVNRKRVG